MCSVAVWLRCCSSSLREVREASRQLVARSYPQLLGLVEDGTLLALERSPSYVERRTDGYQEPHLVFLIGTSHVSSVAASQVYRVVKEVHPENVVVELCRSRAGLMNETCDPTISELNLMAITGKSFSSALRRSLELGGQSALTLRLLLSVVSGKLSSVAGVPSGEEFRAARRASEEVGAQIVLGDRPIEITLRRAWGALNWQDRLKLAVILLRGISSPKLDLSEESLQALTSDDAISTMFNYLSQEFPTLLQPLVHERDQYLAWSLTRSKAVNGSTRVVGVMGRGHIRGVVHVLKHPQKENLHFRDLVGSEESRRKGSVEQVRQLIQRLLIETVIGGILWFAIRLCFNDVDVGVLFSHMFTDLVS